MCRSSARPMLYWNARYPAPTYSSTDVRSLASAFVRWWHGGRGRRSPNDSHLALHLRHLRGVHRRRDHWPLLQRCGRRNKVASCSNVNGSVANSAACACGKAAARRPQVCIVWTTSQGRALASANACIRMGLSPTPIRALAVCRRVWAPVRFVTRQTTRVRTRHACGRTGPCQTQPAACVDLRIVKAQTVPAYIARGRLVTATRFPDAPYSRTQK